MPRGTDRFETQIRYLQDRLSSVEKGVQQIRGGGTVGRIEQFSDTAAVADSITLSSSSTDIIDNWEDGDPLTTASADWGDWTYIDSNNGTLTNTSSPALSGTQSGAVEAGGSGNDAWQADRTSIETPTEVRALAQMETDVGNSNDGAQIQFRQGSDKLFEFEFQHGTGDLRVLDASGRTTLQSWSAGTTYDLRIEAIDFAAETFEAVVDGTNYGTFDFVSTATGFDRIQLFHSTAFSGTVADMYVDDITEVI